MRTIKFRAFVLGKMYDVHAVEFNEHGTLIITDGGFHTIENGTRDDVSHLMQFTDLLDKNGKEIYEGDKIKVVSHTTMISDGERMAFESRIYEVVSRKFAYMGKLVAYEMLDNGPRNMPDIGFPIHHYLHEMSDDVTVIGNIHEATT